MTSRTISRITNKLTNLTSPLATDVADFSVRAFPHSPHANFAHETGGSPFGPVGAGLVKQRREKNRAGITD
jgi:hypothetical protein